MNTPESDHELAAAVTKEILGELRDRKGFDGWWSDIDDETQQELRAALEKRAQDVIAIHQRKQRT